MKRRTLLFGLGSTALLGGTTVYGFMESTSPDQSQATGQTRTDFVDKSEVPDAVEPFQEIAYDYHNEIDSYYPDSRVFLETDGIVHLFQPNGDSANDLKAEFHRVAKVFANTFAETDETVPAPTFTAVSGEVQAIVTPTVLKQYRAGNLKESAVVETVEITSIDRDTGDNTAGGHDHSSHDHDHGGE